MKREKHVQFNSADVLRLGQPLIDFFNETQKAGVDQHQLLAVWTFVMGSTAAQLGVAIDLDRLVREALPPFASGYARATDRFLLDAKVAGNG